MSRPGLFRRLPRLPETWRAPAAIVLIAALAGAGAWLWRAHDRQMEARLLAAPMDKVASDKALVRYASGKARPLFARYCASCHGADMKGKAGTGAPSLTDHVWLYGGGVYRIDRDILYGLRSGRQRANDLTEMPAFGQRGQLSEGEIRNVVQYVLQLAGRPADATAAQEGAAVYAGHAACYDCHTGDGRGNIDYGATDLTANVWDYGGDPKSLYDSIYYGRHGIMPAWIGKLSLTQIRALAVYVNAASQR